MDASNLAALTSSGISLVGLAFAGYELRRLRVDAFERRVAELSSVCVVTDVVIRPWKAEPQDHRSKWVYKFHVHNPGSLPISDVRVTIHFLVDVERLHGDGQVDAPRKRLEMYVPVVLAGQSKPWDRQVLIDHEDRHQLSATRATVEFSTPDAGRLSNTWPEEVGSSIRRPLAQRLRSRSVPKRSQPGND